MDFQFFRRSSALILALSLGILSGCSNSTADNTTTDQNDAQPPETVVTEEPISVLCPSGAPALATLGLYDLDIDITYTQGQEELVAQLAKSDSEYDVIIAPINLGVISYAQNPVWDLQSVLTWGNLYIVGNPDWNSAEGMLAAFGQGAVPGLVFNDLYPDVEASVSWNASVAEAGQSFLAGQDSAALLAQPQVQVVINQAGLGEDGVVADLQELWQQKHSTSQKGYPQAAIFSHDLSDDQITELTDAIDAFDESSDEEKTARIDEIGAEKLGVPSAEIAIKTWDAQNIHNIPAEEVKSDIETFLAVFGIEIDPAIFARSE